MDEYPEEPDLPVMTVTCRTVGCLNEGARITLACAEVVVCGACGAEIADIRAPDVAAEEAVA